VRFITKKETSYIGKCIYCDATGDNLSDEHVSPLALNGKLVLEKASCSDCSKITSKLELHVLREMWGAARMATRFSSRHSKRKDTTYPLIVIKNGSKKTLRVPLRDALKIIELPIYLLPAILNKQSTMNKTRLVSKDQFIFEESKETLAKRLNVDEVCSPEFDPNIFMRFIAKCALGYAIEQYGFNAFEAFFIRDGILGRTDDLGQWVGSPTTRELPIRNTPMSVGFRILPDNNVGVRLKLFARYDGAEYIVIVGQMKTYFSEQYRLIKNNSEVPRSIQHTMLE
jgi:hypothetical protein